MFRIADGAGSGAGGSVISGAEAVVREIFAGDWRGGGATALSSRPVRASMRTIIMTRVVLPAEAARAMALPAVITGNSIEQIRIILFYLLPDLRHRAHLIMTHLIIMLSFLHELGGVRAGRRQELQNGM